MKTLQTIICVIGLGAIAFSARADNQPTLDEHLEPFRPLLEKTYAGTLKNSKPGKPIVDVQRWERALNGKAVRMTHSINDGVYGGETLFIWDNKKKSVVYYYFTTADFMTTGTITFANGTWITHEVVEGDPDGITETRSTDEMQADGSLRVKAEYLKKGGWIPGHEATYREDAAAKVAFK
jgi:hypothetical protein